MLIKTIGCTLIVDLNLSSLQLQELQSFCPIDASNYLPSILMD